MTLELIPYTDTSQARASLWLKLTPEERKRKVVQACLTLEGDLLWSLVETYLHLFGQKGGHTSPHTRKAYRKSLKELLEHCGEGRLSLLRASGEDGAVYLRALEARFKPSSVQVKLAGVRLLYRALNWAGLEQRSPFGEVRAAPDPTPAWDKRRPYSESDLEKLLTLEEPLLNRLILLGAHAGLRASESVALVWGDIDFSSETLVVRSGKGGKQRRVPLSGRLQSALERVRSHTEKPLELSLYTLRERMLEACARAGVVYLGYHALRHYAGTRLYRESGDLETVARLLGHSSLETTRIYAKWSEEGVRSRVKGW